MATRNVTYQFDWGFATFDRNTEQDRIDEIETQNSYLAKFDVNMDEREIIDSKKSFLKVVDGELIVRESTIFDAVGSLIPGGE